MMRYRRNGKQVLRDGCVMAGGTHIADCVSEDVAELIVEALNNFDHPLDMFITAPPRDDEPSLFGLGVVLDSSVPPGTVKFRHPDGRTDTVVMEPDPPCSIRQYSDQYSCVTHKRQWDVNDPDPPMPCGGNVL